jgi:hypothetical protein
VDNQTIAQKLSDYARSLDGEEANVHRVRAYRRAAEVVRALPRPLADVYKEQGKAGLEALPGIGSHLAFTLEGLVTTGEFRTLRPPDAHVDPERLLTSLPGVGPQLAHQLRERLGITSLEELERAAHQGRLAQVGIGPKRLRGLMDALTVRLRRPQPPDPTANEPSVAELLALDAEYRRRAEQGGLPRLAPENFNPGHEAWLPLFKVTRGDFSYRVLFSNTALAHRLDKTRDWVVIYFDNGSFKGQRTVITEKYGDLVGRRVVRGRERECRELMTSRAEPAA